MLSPVSPVNLQAATAEPRGAETHDVEIVAGAGGAGAVAGRSLRLDPHAAVGIAVAQAAHLSRARLSRRRRLHGPRQLGDLARRRLEVRLRAAVRRAAVQSHGDRCCSRCARGSASPPGATSRRPAATPSRDWPSWPLWVVGRNRHLRDRPRRGHRHGDRAQSSCSAFRSRSAC